MLIALPSSRHYNKSVHGGIDKSDMMIYLYRIRMKSKKWFRVRRLIFHIVDLCCSNAWHLDKAEKGTRSKYYKFKLAIAQCLTQGYPNPQPMLRENIEQIPQVVHSARHVPDILLFLSRDFRCLHVFRFPLTILTKFAL